MYLIALLMLTRNKMRYFTIVFGLALSTFIMTLQPAIYKGTLVRTYSYIDDITEPDIWVMNPNTQQIDITQNIPYNNVYRIRSIPGVAWAVPLIKDFIRARIDKGVYNFVSIIGVDDTTLIGIPKKILQGKATDLHRINGILVDNISAKNLLATPNKWGKLIPLQLGQNLEINDMPGRVVGITKISPNFQSYPVVYTTFSQEMMYAPNNAGQTTFILVKAKPYVNPSKLAKLISKQTGLMALTNNEFRKLTVSYYTDRTAIPVIFRITIILGFIVGLAIAGQNFYFFTLSNLPYLGLLKAMGANNNTVLKMIFLQAMIAGLVGYGIGAGMGSLFGLLLLHHQIAFQLSWFILFGSGCGILAICVLAASTCAYRVLKLEPAIVFRM